MSALLGAIVPYYTSTKGRIPTDQVMESLGARQLEVGEIAFNLEDSLIFSKKPDGSIVQMGGSTLGKLLDVDAGETNPPSPGQALIWNGSSWSPRDRSNLRDLEDVSGAIPFDSAVLQYDSVRKQWVPGEAGIAGGLRVKAMDLGEVLTYDEIRVESQWLLNFDTNNDNGDDTFYEIGTSQYDQTQPDRDEYPVTLSPTTSDEKFGDSSYIHYGKSLGRSAGLHGLRIPADHVGPALRTSEFTLEFWFKSNNPQLGFRAGGKVLIGTSPLPSGDSIQADAGWLRVKTSQCKPATGPGVPTEPYVLDFNAGNSTGLNNLRFHQYALTPEGQRILRTPEAKQKTLALRGQTPDTALNTPPDDQFPLAIEDSWDWYDGGDTAELYPGGPWNENNPDSREQELLASESRGDYPPNLDQYDYTWTSYDEILGRGNIPVTNVGSRWSPHIDDAEHSLYLSNSGSGTAGAGSDYLCGTRDAELYDGEWHHIVFQHEGEGVYSCFVDGVLKERRYRMQLQINTLTPQAKIFYRDELGIDLKGTRDKTLLVGPVDFWQTQEMTLGEPDFEAHSDGVPCQIDGLRLLRYSTFPGKDSFTPPDVAPDRIYKATKWINKAPFPAPVALQRNLVDTNVATTVFVASGNLNGQPSGAIAFTAGDYLGNEYDLDFDWNAAQSTGPRLTQDWPAYPEGAFYFDGGTPAGVRPSSESGSIKQIGSQDYTISLWFRFDGDNGDIDAGDNDAKWLIKLGEQGPAVGLMKNGRIRWKTGAGFISTTASGIWSANQDYHVALVRSADEDRFILFLNGNEIDNYPGAAGNIVYDTPYTVPQLGESPDEAGFNPDKVGFQGWIAEVVIKIGQAFWTDTFTPPPVWGDGSFEFPNTVFGALGIWEDRVFICSQGATYEIDGAVKEPSVWMPLGGGAGSGGGGGELGDLLNVDLISTLPLPGDILSWDGNNWVPRNKLALDLQLEELGNVVHEDIRRDGTPFNREGSSLVWSEVDKQWKPGFPTLSRLREPAELPGVTIAEFYPNPLYNEERNGSGWSEIDGFFWLMEGPRSTRYANDAAMESDGWTVITSNRSWGNYSFEMPYEEFWDLQVMDGLVGNTPSGGNGETWSVGRSGIGWRTDGTHYNMGFSGASNPQGQSTNWDAWFQYFSLIQVDLERAAHKKVVRDGRPWLVIHIQWQVPYVGGLPGWNTEFWLSEKGEVVFIIGEEIRYANGGNSYVWTFNEKRGAWSRGETLTDAAYWANYADDFSFGRSLPSAKNGAGWYFKPGRVDPNPPVIWDGNGLDDLKDVKIESVSEGDALLWDGDSNFVPTQVLTKVDTLSQVLDVDASALQGIPRESGYVLTWDNTLQQWAPKPIPLPKIGRGDAGDFDLGETQGIFLFGVYGGGDFTTGEEDLPIELTAERDTDGGELTGGIPEPPPEDRSNL